MICENCNVFHTGSYGSGRFCSPRCARCFSTKAVRVELNERIRKKLTKEKVGKLCPVCKEDFVPQRKRNKTCSKKCGNIWRCHPDNPYSNEYRLKCSKAGRASAELQKNNRRSLNEKLFFDLCLDLWPDALANQRFFSGWDADVILPSMSIAILWNGPWHYKKITKHHSVEQVQNRDLIKIREIKNKGYTPYIIKDLGKYNPDFVYKEFGRFISFLNNEPTEL